MRSAGEVGRDTIRNPGALPGKAQGWFKRYVGKIWRVRGGGLYACGYVIAFLWFEVVTIISEMAAASGVGDYIASQATEFITRFLTDTFRNMIAAFIWPVYVVAISPPVGAIALGLGFILFPKYLKKPIERWLFDGELDQHETEKIEDTHIP
ncbi:MAG: hypothetical protein OES12_06330 [Anaerolineae bacterium]|nr:hypothetical protein [Anaerolineae bacterium]